MTLIKCSIAVFLLLPVLLSCGKTTDPEVNPALRVQSVPVTANAFYMGLGSNPTTVDTSSFTVTNVGEGRLDWTVSRDQPWIVVFPDRGNTVAETDQVEIYVDVEGLKGGLNTGTVSILSAHGVVEIPIEVVVPIWTGKLTLSTRHLEVFGDLLDWTLIDTITVDFFFDIDSNGIDAVGSGRGRHDESFIPDSIELCQLVGIQSEEFNVGITGTVGGINRIALSFNTDDLLLKFNLNCSDGTYDTAITFYEGAETVILNQLVRPEVPFFDGGFDPPSPRTDPYTAWDSVPDINYGYKVMIYKNE